MKITAYVVDERRILPQSVLSPTEIPARAVWVDVIEPTRDEMLSLAEQLGLHLDLDQADLGFDVYGHVEVERNQLTMIMQAERAGAADGLPNVRGVIILSTDKLVTFRSGSEPALLAHRALAES